jgi:hypothetical protein
MTIPATVNEIDENAFKNSGALNTVNFAGREPSVGSDAFVGVGLGATARVKRTSTEFTVGGDGLWNGLKVSRVLK